MDMTETTEIALVHGLALMRAPFPEHQISKLPKPLKKDAPKGKCGECGGWHGLPAVHLDYVGHAALTARLLDADAAWSWEPMSIDASGLPALDRDGGMWIRLTVCGVSRLGYGDAQGKSGGDAMKERIGDALRNAAMRFGAALDLWHKGDLYRDDPEPAQKPDGNPMQRGAPEPTAKKDMSPAAVAARITAGVQRGEAAGAALAMSGFDATELAAVWDLLENNTHAALTAAWPKTEKATS